MAYPDHMNPIEARICDLILQGALQRGWKITVRDEDRQLGLAAQWNDDWNSITGDIAATSQTYLHFYEPGFSPRFVGWVLLVHGNEEDVISDHTTHPAMGDLVDEVQKAWENPNATRLIAVDAITLGQVPPVSGGELSKVARAEGLPGLRRELARFCIRLSIPLASPDELLARYEDQPDGKDWLSEFLAAEKPLITPLEGDIA